MDNHSCEELIKGNTGTGQKHQNGSYANSGGLKEKENPFNQYCDLNEINVTGRNHNWSYINNAYEKIGERKGPYIRQSEVTSVQAVRQESPPPKPYQSSKVESNNLEGQQVCCESNNELKSSKFSSRCVPLIVAPAVIVVVVLMLGTILGIMLSKEVIPDDAFYPSTTPIIFPTTTTTQAIHSTPSEPSTTTTVPKSTLTSTGPSSVSTGTTPHSSTPHTSGPSSTTLPLKGTWAGWSVWSDCGVTCGAGVYTRSRECLHKPCIGVGIQQDSCYAGLCPSPADAFGTWTTWERWGSCRVSCDSGTQSRSRICDIKTELGQAQCRGETDQTRGCNEGNCPDDTLTCGQGDNGLKCWCPGNTVSGKVLTTAGAPLEYVQVSYAEFGHTPLAITDDHGLFSLQDVCQIDALLFSLNGYIEKSAVLDHDNDIVRLVEIEHLSMIKEPVSAAAIVGGCVHLECEAAGSPGPDYYEWFHDDLLIIGVNSQNLTIADITTNEAGNYKCRANNDFTAIVSRVVKITVEEQESEICDSIPRENLVQLPYGCEINGEAMIDVGNCAPTNCALQNEKACDSPPIMSQCGVTAYTEQIVQCTNYDLPVKVVAECGCLITDFVRSLRGQVLDVDTHNPLSFADVTVNGNGPINTDTSGRFAYDVPLSITRLNIEIVHSDKKHSPHSTVVTMDEGTSNAFAVFYVSRKPDPVIFSSSNETVIPVASSAETEPLIDITVPPNSFYDSNGNQYDGQVSAYVDYYDSRDSVSLGNAPGDFTASNSEGEEEFLESGGMVKMEFTDSSGNQLNVGTNLSLSFMLNVTDLEIADGMKLWTLDGNGRWQFLSNVTTEEIDLSSRRRRQINSRTFGLRAVSENIQGVRVTGRWVNMDKIARNICYSKVRLYYFDNLARPYDQNVQVQAITLAGAGSTVNTVSQIRASSDPQRYSAQCIVHPCDTTRSSNHYNYKGYIVARSGNDYFHPLHDQNLENDYNFEIVGDKIAIDFHYNSSSKGPFYDYNGWWRNSPSCSNAPSSDRSFKFYKDPAPCTTRSYPTGNDVFKPSDPRLFYYSSKHDQMKQIQVCFMRVKISTNHPKVVLTTRSSTEDGTLLYGLRQMCVEGDNYACIEYKAPGNIYHNASFTSKEKTSVYVELEDQYDISNLDSKVAGSVIYPSQRKAHLMLDYMDSAVQFDGRHCDTFFQTTIDDARETVLNNCKTETDPTFWAFHFRND